MKTNALLKKVCSRSSTVAAKNCNHSVGRRHSSMRVPQWTAGIDLKEDVR